MIAYKEFFKVQKKAKKSKKDEKKSKKQLKKCSYFNDLEKKEDK
jgi:hypothetical protein